MQETEAAVQVTARAGREGLSSIVVTLLLCERMAVNTGLNLVGKCSTTKLSHTPTGRI